MLTLEQMSILSKENILYYTEIEQEKIRVFEIKNINTIRLPISGKESPCITLNDINTNSIIIVDNYAIKEMSESNWFLEIGEAKQYLQNNKITAIFYEGYEKNIITKENCCQVFNENDNVELSNGIIVKIKGVIKCINGKMKYNVEKNSFYNYEFKKGDK